MCDLSHFQPQSGLIKMSHRSDTRHRGPARGGIEGLAPEESCALLEVKSWILPKSKVPVAEFAARTNLVVYLNPTRTVVVFGCYPSISPTEFGR